MQHRFGTEVRRAVDLADTATDRERLFILATYYGVQKSPKMTDAYEALLRLYPDHYWAANNLENEYWLSGRWSDVVALTIRTAEARPDDLPRNAFAACVKSLDNDEESLPFANAFSLAAASANVPTATFVGLLPAFHSWSHEHRSSGLSYRSLKDAENSTKQVIYFYLAFGQFRKLGTTGRVPNRVSAFLSP